MRKFLFPFVLVLALPVLAQQSFVNHPNGMMPDEGSDNLPMQSTGVFKTAGGIVSGRINPGLSVLMYRGQATTSGGIDQTNIGGYVSPLYMDSTVRCSFKGAGTSYINKNKLGITFDPKSTVFDASYIDPLFNGKDIYYLDTVWLGGVYKTVRPSIVDTLIVEIVWGDTNNTSVYSNFSYSLPSLLASFGSFSTPYFNNSKQHGDACYLAAPPTNRKVIRRAITPADTANLRKTRYIPVVLNGATGLQLKASDLVTVMYTYKPGSAVPAGAVVYNGGGLGPDPQTENGFAAYVFQQKNPAPINDDNIANYFDDPKGKNYALSIYSDQRYGLLKDIAAPFNKMGEPEPIACYWIDFSIHGTSTVGIKNYNSDLLLLGQNTPNPAIHETTIYYSLKSNAKEVKLTLTDLMGREVYTETIGSKPSGAYSVNLNTSGLPAGVYYYSLQVDGAIATKKMMISK